MSDEIKKRGRPADPDSVMSQLSNLQIGDTYASAVRLDGEASPPAWSAIQAEKQRIRNTLNGQIRVARQRTSAEYKSSIGEFRADDGDIIIAAVVTRTG